MIEKVTLEMNDKSGFDLEGGRKCNDLNPKAMLLYAAAKCAGLTALRAMQQEKVVPNRFEIHMSGEISTDTLQAESVFRSFNVVYNIECARYEDQSKASHAVNLSHEHQCGMMRMMRQIAPVSHEIAIVSTQPEEV